MRSRLKAKIFDNKRFMPFRSFTDIIRSRFSGIKVNKLIVMSVFHCDPDQGSHRISLSFNTILHNLLMFWLLWMHARPILSRIPTSFNRTAYNNCYGWKNCFWCNISNNTLLWNESNTALPSHSILWLYFFKHRPLKFRDCARSPNNHLLP
jgi:hypothetical protein